MSLDSKFYDEDVKTINEIAFKVEFMFVDKFSGKK